MTLKDKTELPSETFNRIQALIHLLGDEDFEVRKVAREHLIRFGAEATDILDEVVHTDCEGKTRIQARTILDQINRQELIQDFHLLSVWNDENIDLERGAYLLAKFAYPKLRQHEISSELDRLAMRVQELIGGRRSPGYVVAKMNTVLFDEACFRGNTESYYSAGNSYLNKVLTRRTGIPITLSLVYILIAKRLDLPIYGVNMPMHFLCKYDASPEPFYLDAFHQGQVMTRAECISFLRRSGVGFKESYLRRASNRDILSRMLRNLILVYYHNEQDSHAAFLKRLLKILRFYAKKQESL